MTNDSAAIVDFLSRRPPFDQVPGATVRALSEKIEQREVDAGDTLVIAGGPDAKFYIVASGEVEVRAVSDGQARSLGEGQVFGLEDLLDNEQGGIKVTATVKSSLFAVAAPEFHRLCDDYPGFRNSLYGESTSTIPLAGAGSSLMRIAVSDLVSRDAVTASPTLPVRDAAVIMRREGISSLLVANDGKLVGIVTDRDLRNRVIADGLSLDVPLHDVMTPSPLSIDVRRQGHEALVEMMRSRYRHLPVVDGERIVGMITNTDLLQQYATSSLFIIAEVHRAQDVAALVRISQRVRPLQVALLDGNVAYATLGRVISSIGEAITSRLLLLAEEQLGESPVPFAWLTGGSMARFEQTSHSDQDNCLLLDDAYDETEHGPYFATLSRFVCDALNDCGYVYCPGDIMATTDKWRQPLRVWKGYFKQWIEQPEPKALMLASIFFDLRLLHGDGVLFNALRDYIRPKASKNQIFHAFMTTNALTHEPPLGFFRNFTLVRDGQHDRTLDLKHSGVIPIVDLARVYALAGGVTAVNTLERLEAAAAAGTVSQPGCADLRAAMEFIGTLRLRHEANRIRDGLEPNNFVPPASLSHLERSQLKDAFAVVRTMQASLSQRYQASALR